MVDDLFGYLWEIVCVKRAYWVYKEHTVKIPSTVVCSPADR